MTKIGRFVIPAALLGLLAFESTHASAATLVPFKALRAT